MTRGRCTYDALHDALEEDCLSLVVGVLHLLRSLVVWGKAIKPRSGVVCGLLWPVSPFETLPGRACDRGLIDYVLGVEWSDRGEERSG